MYTQVTFNDFYNAFQAVRPDNFSRDGLRALFDYYEDLEAEVGMIELDVIAICCEWTEASYDEFEEMYPDIEPYDGILEFLYDNTTVIELPDGKLLATNF